MASLDYVDTTAKRLGWLQSSAATALVALRTQFPAGPDGACSWPRCAERRAAGAMTFDGHAAICPIERLESGLAYEPQGRA